MTVTFVPGEPPARVAFGVSRRVGNAVARNQLKRRLRAIVRDLDRHGEVAPGAYLLSVQPDATALPYADLAAQVSTSMAELSR